MSENTFWILLLCIVGAVVGAVAWAIAWGCTIEARTALQNGYRQEKLPTMYETHWVKP